MLVIHLTGAEAPSSVPGGAIFELAVDRGISSSRARRLRVMVDELVHLAQLREHGDRPAEVTVRAWTESGHLYVEVNDHGIPVFDDDTVIPHELVRLGFAEFIELHSHGREGNVARCSLHLSEMDARGELADREQVLSEDAPEAEPEAEFHARAMLPSECDALARLVYRCYGYDYPADEIYYPERMSALIDGGLMHSAVVCNEAGELVAHASLTLARSKARIAEAGKLVVDPRYRSHGLARKVATLRLERAAELGLLGLWTECVSNHPFSQKNQRKLGARETGVFMGMLPASVQMVGLESEAEERGSLIPMYLPLAGSPARELYVPERYRELIAEIAEHLELERELTTRGAPAAKESRISVSVNRLLNVAVIDVAVAGADFLERLETHMEHLYDMRVSSVYLDLHLGDPGSAHAGDHVAGHGFFFSALLPESGAVGDVLRLQVHNHEHITPESIQLATDWGEGLLTRCVEDRARVLEESRRRRLEG